MNWVRGGELPWTNFDRLHRLSLDQVLSELGVEGFDSAARDELTMAWERLPPWPDAARGLERLPRPLARTTPANGNRTPPPPLIPFARLHFQPPDSAAGVSPYKPVPQ